MNARLLVAFVVTMILSVSCTVNVYMDTPVPGDIVETDPDSVAFLMPTLEPTSTPVPTPIKEEPVSVAESAPTPTLIKEEPTSVAESAPTPTPTETPAAAEEKSREVVAQVPFQQWSEVLPDGLQITVANVVWGYSEPDSIRKYIEIPAGSDCPDCLFVELRIKTETSEWISLRNFSLIDRDGNADPVLSHGCHTARSLPPIGKSVSAYDTEVVHICFKGVDRRNHDTVSYINQDPLLRSYEHVRPNVKGSKEVYFVLGEDMEDALSSFEEGDFYVPFPSPSWESWFFVDPER